MSELEAELARILLRIHRLPFGWNIKLISFWQKTINETIIFECGLGFSFSRLKKPHFWQTWNKQWNISRLTVYFWRTMQRCWGVTWGAEVFRDVGAVNNGRTFRMKCIFSDFVAILVYVCIVSQSIQRLFTNLRYFIWKEFHLNNLLWLRNETTR